MPSKSKNSDYNTKRWFVSKRNYTMFDVTGKFNPYYPDSFNFCLGYPDAPKTPSQYSSHSIEILK